MRTNNVLALLLALSIPGYCIVNAQTTVPPDQGLTTPQMVRRQGYPVESHKVTTSDGYVLKLHRMPRPGRPAVLVMHGILASSAQWVEQGPEHGLAYQLFNKGFDVWMGNVRGSTYSTAHNLLPTEFYERKYWDFSWHEIGVYDLPATIDYVLKNTSQSQLSYVGHSMGTTIFWVLASQRPEYNAKIRQMHAMSPVAFFTENPDFKVKQYKFITENVLPTAHVYKVDVTHTVLAQMITQLCIAFKLTQCQDIFFKIMDQDQQKLNQTLIPVLLSHYPDTSSVKAVNHFFQQFDTGRFSQYDEGLWGNLAKYNSWAPPEYDLSKVTAPVFMYTGTSDMLVMDKDVKKLQSRIPGFRSLSYIEDFSHMDFLWSVEARPRVYDAVVATLAK